MHGNPRIGCPSVVCLWLISSYRLYLKNLNAILTLRLLDALHSTNQERAGVPEGWLKVWLGDMVTSAETVNFD